MKVIHLLSNPWNSAISEWALSCFKALQLKGMAHQEFLVLAESQIIPRFAAGGVPFTEVPFTEVPNFHAHLLLSPALDRIRAADVIFCYGGPEESALQLLKSKRQKLIRFVGYQRRSSTMRRWLNGRTNLYLYPARAVQEDQKNAYLIPLGIDVAEKASREVAPPPTDPFRILILGRLDHVKGHQKALQILACLKSPEVHLAIVGMPIQVKKEELEEVAKVCGVQERVHFLTEKIKDIPSLYAQYHLVWVPSLGSEWITRVSFEALVNGLPVFCSDAGALPEAVAAEKGFGLSYSNQWSLERIATDLDLLIEQVRQQTIQEKRVRAKKARALFGLETMGQSLLDLLRASKSF